jgi:hypothetical protein
VIPFHPVPSPRAAAERTPSSTGVPCVLFALSRESRPFLRSLRPRTRLCGAPFPATLAGRRGTSVLVVESGPGVRRTAHALDWLLQPPHRGILPSGISCVISAGFAGALREGYGVGDTIVATEIVDVRGNRWSASWPDLPGAEESRLPRGRLLTTPNVIGTTAEKRRLGKIHNGVAVDMESAIVAAWCAERAIHFGAVRTISDPVEMELSPELLSLFGDRMPAAAQVIGALRKKPTLAKELWRLARNTRAASQRLGVALGTLLRTR